MSGGDPAVRYYPETDTLYVELRGRARARAAKRALDSNLG